MNEEPTDQAVLATCHEKGIILPFNGEFFQ
jgi:hypothetical protein